MVRKPGWLKASGVKDIYSASGCISKDFSNYINFCKHNGYWLLDSPEVTERQELNDEKEIWRLYEREESFATNVCLPAQKTLVGFEVVSSLYS